MYTPATGTAEISITTEDGTELNSWKTAVEKGVNVIEYDVSLSAKGKKALEKKDMKLKEADNGVLYLPKGMYEIKIQMNGKSATQPLELK